jgi:Tol biopolymer transport system component
MPLPLTRWLLVLLVLICSLAGCSFGGSASRTDRLVITRDKSLAELSLKTKGERLLITAPQDTTLADPAVSPDGTRIAYTQLLTPVVVPGQNTDLGSDVSVANADGSNPTPVVRHQVRSEQVLSPAWLPDGSGLLFSVQRFENQQIVSTIEKIVLATGERTVVVQNAYQPTISRDGTKIAFMRTEADYTQSVWVASADGSGEQRLAGEAQQLVSFQSPRFSPDGRYLATGGAGQASLQGRMATSDGREFVLSSGGAGAGTIEVDPDGLPEDVWLIDLSTGALRRIAQIKLDSPSLAWTPDGRWLYAFGDRGLYLIDPKKSSATRLAEGEFHGQADWLAAN